MKVLLYQGGQSFIKTSGIGRALEHQEEALSHTNVTVTKNKKDEYDILQVNTIFPDSFFLAKKARRRGKKVVYYAHSTAEDFKNSFIGSNLFAGLFKKWISRCYEQGNLIVTPTFYSKQLLSDMGIKKPIVAISNGIDLSFFERKKGDGESLRKKWGLSEEDKIILSTGHYIERKGITEFVDLAKELPSYTFVWLGYTNLAVVPPVVRRAVQTELPNLYFPGFVSKETLRDALAIADLFLFLTFEETEGIALQEAFAMKTPVLVRDIPIYEELIEGKHVYKAKKTKEFHKKICEIVEGKFSSTIEEAYRYVSEKDLSIIGSELAELYTHVMQIPEINE